jgi:hypothetical protein
VLLWYRSYTLPLTLAGSHKLCRQQRSLSPGIIVLDIYRCCILISRMSCALRYVYLVYLLRLSCLVSLHSHHTRTLAFSPSRIHTPVQTLTNCLLRSFLISSFSLSRCSLSRCSLSRSNSSLAVSLALASCSLVSLSVVFVSLSPLTVVCSSELLFL